ncbi:MAG TPA: tetratricopeptide repeat protein [Polyangiales bacterium]|nr:tetratricopeptide repeat protein [Polyangiales bacterium]
MAIRANSPSQWCRRASQSLAGLWLAFVLASIPLQPLAAQSNETASDPSRDASARVLFEEGVGLAEKGEWAGAEDRFRRALSLRNSPVIAYNLASALAERGKLIEASEILRKIIQDDKTDAAMQHSVQSLQSDLSRRIGRISVSVHGKRADDRILLDGVALLDAQLGVDIPIDPGPHRLSFDRGGKTIDAKELEIAAGASEQVVLTAPLVPSPREAAVAAQRAPDTTALPPLTAANVDRTADRSAPITSRWWFWTGIGVVAVGAVVIAVAASSGGTKPEAAYQGSFTPASLRVQVAP